VRDDQPPQYANHPQRHRNHLPLEKARLVPTTSSLPIREFAEQSANLAAVGRSGARESFRDAPEYSARALT
jgi:hypothetical protein